ncbi:hypothetical protein [Bradyrhizobium sp. Rc2d]|uniref:hypothetical protein n=1 Tax=Bradyrhizobium sp. Rc2d TaxID=1855321 RepID=UPI001FCDE62C|nr:hypothetical protein [Bradyrhizobium sp. Rc2d]
MLDRPADRARDHGWVYGLPPGITSEEWPLDPVSGYPLMHGFTLLLPEDYRVHGEDIVAVSFFATAPDHNDGGAPDDPEIREAVLALPAHPRLSRMTDILDYEYAALLLTKAEYEGALATPPAPIALAAAERPRWLDVGGASAFFEAAPPYGQKMFASAPRAALIENRAFRCRRVRAIPTPAKARRTSTLARSRRPAISLTTITSAACRAATISACTIGARTTPTIISAAPCGRARRCPR